MSGKLVIFSAPSGAGKTTLVKYILSQQLPLEFSISATSRNPRGVEIDGKDYYFLTESEFRKKIENNEFVEWEEVYPGSFYGTLKSEITRIWDKGKHVLFDIDVKGGVNLKHQFPNNSLSLFIMPPSVEELEKRLINRSTDDMETIRKRVAKAKEELTFSDKFDKIIINDILENAQSETLKTILEFINPK